MVGIVVVSHYDKLAEGVVELARLMAPDARIVGAGGIGSPLVQSITYGRWSNVGAFLLALIILVLIIEYASTKIRNRLARGKAN